MGGDTFSVLVLPFALILHLPTAPDENVRGQSISFVVLTPWLIRKEILNLVGAVLTAVHHLSPSLGRGDAVHK